MSGLFAAVHESVYGPFRQILQRKRTSAFSVITEVAAKCFKRCERPKRGFGRSLCRTATNKNYHFV